MDMILLVVPGISQILSVYFRIFGWQIHMYGKNGNFYGSTKYRHSSHKVHPLLCLGL